MENTEQLQQIRHSLAHLLAAAVLESHPSAKLTLGPAIDNGFYYDIDFGKDGKKSDFALDLKEIEKSMKKKLSNPAWAAFSHKEVSKAEAEKKYKKEKNEYKLELIKEIAGRKEPITFYTVGDFEDLCRGGHVESLKEIQPDSFKLERVAGAYWRGDEKNPMLTRIYGLAFATKGDLDAYEKQVEEAKKRDHRVIGQKQKLFTISELVGSGLPLLQPKGMVIRTEIENYLWQLHKNKGYSRVWTPHITKMGLYETSGHAAKFGEELFRVKGGDEEFFIKPMNCPHHMQLFADNQFSYRDMPVRYFEPATVYRYEKAGQLAGLTRVRAITQDDGHLFCRVSQINQEVGTIVNIIKEFYTTMGMMEGYWVRLSVRGEDKKLYLGEDSIWQKAETALEEAAKENNLNYKRAGGEAAFYGPKLDFMFKDAIGREWQLATIQCDFNLPERFNLSFTNEEGKEERPVVIHRVISGSLERFMGMMIEHFAGSFPLWLSPVQMAIIPISEKHVEYANTIAKQFMEAGFRFEVFSENETLGKKIRQAETQRVPYLLVVGDKEIEAQSVGVRKRDTGDMGLVKVKEFIAMAQEEINSKK